MLMIKLKIIRCDNYTYKLKSESGEIYDLNIEFFDLDEKPNKRDYIYMSEELLNPIYEGYSKSYTFGSLQNIYGRDIIPEKDVDCIKVKINKKEILLKRLYG